MGSLLYPTSFLFFSLLSYIYEGNENWTLIIFAGKVTHNVQ